MDTIRWSPSAEACPRGPTASWIRVASPRTVRQPGSPIGMATSTYPLMSAVAGRAAPTASYHRAASSSGSVNRRYRHAEPMPITRRCRQIRRCRGNTLSHNPVPIFQSSVESLQSTVSRKRRRRIGVSQDTQGNHVSFNSQSHGSDGVFAMGESVARISSSSCGRILSCAFMRCPSSWTTVPFFSSGP